jgi:hypothetical protein
MVGGLVKIGYSDGNAILSGSAVAASKLLNLSKANEQ